VLFAVSRLAFPTGEADVVVDDNTVVVRPVVKRALKLAEKIADVGLSSRVNELVLVMTGVFHF
jgi:hypothetical protein